MVSSGNPRTLFLICDTSGSMSENGKNTLVRAIARTAEQLIRLGYHCADGIKLVVWNSAAEMVEWNPDDEFPESVLDCSGSANAAALCNLLDTVPGGAFLLLTDGWWSRDDARYLKRWKQAHQPGTLRIVKIGSDANPLLKGDDVFLPDDIFSVLEGWLPSADAAAEREDEDEW